MTYFVDTSVVIALLRGQPPRVRDRWRRVARTKSASIVVSTIVLFELQYGVALSAHPAENAERLRVFLSGAVTVQPFDTQDAATAGQLRAELDRAGQRIGAYDLLVAAQARRAEATLVTADSADFDRVPRLKWQDWTRRQQRRQ